MYVDRLLDLPLIEDVQLDRVAAPVHVPPPNIHPFRRHPLHPTQPILVAILPFRAHNAFPHHPSRGAVFLADADVQACLQRLLVRLRIPPPVLRGCGSGIMHLPLRALLLALGSETVREGYQSPAGDLGVAHNPVQLPRVLGILPPLADQAGREPQCARFLNQSLDLPPPSMRPLRRAAPQPEGATWWAGGGRGTCR